MLILLIVQLCILAMVSYEIIHKNRLIQSNNDEAFDKTFVGKYVDKIAYILFCLCILLTILIILFKNFILIGAFIYTELIHFLFWRLNYNYYKRKGLTYDAYKKEKRLCIGGILLQFFIWGSLFIFW